MIEKLYIDLDRKIITIAKEHKYEYLHYRLDNKPEYVYNTELGYITVSELLTSLEEILSHKAQKVGTHE